MNTYDLNCAFVICGFVGEPPILFSNVLISLCNTETSSSIFNERKVLISSNILKESQARDRRPLVNVDGQWEAAKEDAAQAGDAGTCVVC